MKHNQPVRRQVQEILKSAESYEYALWKCSGRHKIPMVVTGDMTPDECYAGHPYNFISKVFATNSLKSTIKRLLDESQS